MTAKALASKLYKFFTHRNFLYTIFWGYNGLYLLSIGFTGVPLFVGLQGMGVSIPWNVAAMVYILILTPIASVILGFLPRLRRAPEKLATLLFCVELPLVFTAIIRLIFLRALTPILWLFILAGFFAVFGVLVHLFKDKFATKVTQAMHTVSQESAIILVGYMAILFLFFLPIIIAFIIQAIVGFDWSDFISVLFASKGIYFFSFLFFFLLLVITVGFFIVSPIIATVLYYFSFQKSLVRLAEFVGFAAAKRTGIIFAVAFVAVGVLLSVQTRGTGYFEQMERIASASNFTNQQKLAVSLMKEDGAARRALVDAYLSSYRYIGDNRVEFLSGGYKKFLAFKPSAAKNVQKAFNTLAAPFIYIGEFRKDANVAAENYEKIFDSHIQDGERASIVATLGATNTSDDLKAGILDREAKNVHVVKREVAVSTDQNMIARVTFEEEYENTTDRMQEVYYEFSLPTDAVVTGLWLGPDLQYQGVVAPKGAARRTYEAQVTDRIDPALLEQVGPRQYRLRVFPIPPKLQRLGVTDPEKNQRVRFAYLVSNDGGIDLPDFSEIRNAFVDQKTKYSVNGEDTELTASNVIASAAPPCPTSVIQSPGPTGSVLFVPHGVNPLTRDTFECRNDNFGFGDLIGMIKGRKIAVLLDVSYSNRDMDWLTYFRGDDELPAPFPILDLLKQGNSIDLYFFNDNVSEKITLTKEKLDAGFDVVAVGQTNRLYALQQLPAEYDLAFMFTDDGEYDVGKDLPYKEQQKKFPIYVKHMRAIPAYPDGLTKQVIMSGGGVYWHPQDALKHFALTALLREKHIAPGAALLTPTATIIGVDTQGTWVFSGRAAVETFPALPHKNLTPDDSMTDVAAARLIDYFITTGKPLDDIHNIASGASVVSPYSSFIALVNDRQQKQLDREKEQADRFEANFDRNAAVLESPQGSGLLDIGAVPEPEEWALIFVSMGLILFIFRSRIVQFVRARL